MNPSKRLGHGLRGPRAGGGPPAAAAWTGRFSAAACRAGCALVCVALTLHCAGADTNLPAATYQATLREYLAQQDQVRNRELSALQRAAESQRRTAFETALTEHLQALVNPAQAPLPVRRHVPLLWTIIAALSLVLAARLLAPRLVGYFVRRFNPWAPAGPKAAELALAEDPAWTGFVRAMEENLQEAVKELAQASATEDAAGAGTGAPGNPNSFFETAPKRLADLRALFLEFSRAADAPQQPAKVLELLREVQAFKESAAAPGLLPVRQFTAALVGLLTQLSKQPANLTPSTLRTLAAALDLLKDLSVRGVKPNLVSEPPVRLLAVDDEPLTRGLVSRALQKVFGVPDLAPGGTDALALATKHAYDLILLDVEMPGMDGYELCQQLHQLPLNAATPVVFVTRHSDFQARAKSTLHGAQDLIAKPFLAFELALKALTLILRTRLAAGQAAPEVAPAPAAAKPQPVEAAAETQGAAAAPILPAQAAPLASAAADSARTPEPVPATLNLNSPPPRLPKPGLAAAAPAPESAPACTAEAKALLARASAQFQSFRGQLDLLRGTTQVEESNALLAKFYPTVAAFCTEAYCAKLNAAFRLGSALEALLKKLLEKPKLRPPSALESVALALEVLVELAQSGNDLDLDQAPARLLVVDDDPLARRMLGEALQLAFGRPESADRGEAALALAQATPFDLIYLDVVMPGMDGFAACAAIRQTERNRHTPVMFVTSQSDLASRARATASGGSGVIAKPTLPSEITLVTVSLLLRHRLAARAEPEPEPSSIAPKAGQPGAAPPPRRPRLAAKAYLKR